MVILIIGILLIFVSYLTRKQWPPYWGLLIAFIIMGFQDGVEGDFMTYKSYYESMMVNDSETFITEEDEPVWNFLYHFFSSFLPFWAFIALMSAFQCWTLWKVGSKYGSKQYGYLGPILFFFTFSMMLIQMKALREGLAVEMCVLAYYMVTEKRGIIWAILITTTAYFIHNATLVFIPFLLIQIVASWRLGMDDEERNSKKPHSPLFPIIMVIVFFIVFSMKASGLMGWLDMVQLAIGDESRLSDYLAKDQEYIGESNLSLVLIVYNAIMVYISAWFFQRTSRRYRILAIASIIACFGEMILVGVGSLFRIMLFYVIFNIYTYPKIIELVSHKYGKDLAMILLVFLVAYAMKTSTFWMTIAKDDRFGTYHFVFW